MVGIDRYTGAVIDNYASALQSVEVILATRLGSEVLLREFGGGVSELLGRAISVDLFLAWRLLVATAIDLWEPRLRVRRVLARGSVEQLRAGTATMTIEVDYRPRGHLGDFTVARVETFSLSFLTTGIRVNSR